jgi:hypothetical protein
LPGVVSGRMLTHTVAQEYIKACPTSLMLQCFLVEQEKRDFFIMKVRFLESFKLLLVFPRKQIIHTNVTIVWDVTPLVSCTISSLVSFSCILKMEVTPKRWSR